MQTAIIIHIISILIAFFISFFIFFRRKGDRLHKFFGWVFVLGMGISAISSFWIQTYGWFSPIHILSVFTLYWLMYGILSVRFKYKEKPVIANECEANKRFASYKLIHYFLACRGTKAPRNEARKNWKYNHINNMCSAFIGIIIAGTGVIVRQILDPGNNNLGFIVSGITAAIVIPIMIKMIKKYQS